MLTAKLDPLYVSREMICGPLEYMRLGRVEYRFGSVAIPA
jgi:hypothetical protein